MHEVMRHILEPFRYMYFLYRDSNYREYNRLLLKYGRLARFKEVKVQFNSIYEFHIPDAASFLSTYKEIFVDEIYKFSLEKDKKYQIIDCGANIGVSLLYFYKNYPMAQIVGYEADPYIFKYLNSNIYTHTGGIKE